MCEAEVLLVLGDYVILSIANVCLISNQQALHVLWSFDGFKTGEERFNPKLLQLNLYDDARSTRNGKVWIIDATIGSNKRAGSSRATCWISSALAGVWFSIASRSCFLFVVVCSSIQMWCCFFALYSLTSSSIYCSPCVQTSLAPCFVAPFSRKPLQRVVVWRRSWFLRVKFAPSGSLATVW